MSDHDSNLKRHPPGLYVLFFAEMWERFSFYGMRALLVLYMDEQLHFNNEKRSSIYGWYIGLVYFTPLIGGWLADRYLGYVSAIMMGAVLMGLGHGSLAIEQPLFFYGGLLLLILGNGLFKPNISTLVGNLYHDRPALKDRGYNIFYMGINIGAFVAPFVVEGLRNTYGWSYGFAAAGIGMIVSLVTFASFRRLVTSNVQLSAKEEREEALPKAVERDRIIALVIIFVIVILFWMAFEQAGNTMTLWARDSTDSSTVGGWLNRSTLTRWAVGKDGNVAPGIFQSVNSFFIITLTPLIVALWRYLKTRSVEPSTPMKIAIGMLLTGASYVIMSVAGLVGGDHGRVGMSWLMTSYAVISAAELCLSPVGLSLTSKLAPRRLRGLMMGGWFVATAIGDKLSGVVGSYYDRMSHSAFFALLVASSLIAFVLLWIALSRLRRTIDPVA